MRIFVLKKSRQKRFASGHPWVFSNELTASPRDAVPGELVELRAESGEFLARGYAHPHSLIAFRELTRAETQNPDAREVIEEKLAAALMWRMRLGKAHASFRWLHGEADGFPGLIMDVYKTALGVPVCVVQSHTAGIDARLAAILESLPRVLQRRECAAIKTADVGIIVKNTSRLRTLDGVPIEEPRVTRAVSGVDFENLRVEIDVGLSSPLKLATNVLRGQKTGLFLDQVDNISALNHTLPALFSHKPHVKILDLFCYVGAWSTSFAAALVHNNISCDVTLVDSSDSALAFAKANAAVFAQNVRALRADIVEDVSAFVSAYDIIICDPPAFIKRTKDFHAGARAYFKLNTQILSLLNPGGLFVTSSCSGGLSWNDFDSILLQAQTRAQKRVTWFFQGSQAADHPTLLEFPEGQYLKLRAGSVK